MLRLKHIEGGTGGGMMGRLIDAGKFLNNLSGMLKSMEDYDAVRKVINNMPTAYDVDKVVEQLKQNTHDMEICEEQFDMNRPYFKDVPYKMIKLEDAIKIVKAGGKDGN